MDGRRDRIYSVQITDYGPSQQILVQTRSGAIVNLDGTTGARLWQTRVGLPYVVSQPFGYNSKAIFAVNGVSLFALNRANGQLLWEFALPHVPAAAPLADEDRVYITLGTGRFQAYLLPTPAVNVPEAVPTPAAERKSEAVPGAGRPTEEPYKKSTSALGISGQSVQSISALSSRGQSVRSIGALSSAAQAGEKLVTGPQPLLSWEYESDTRLDLAPLLTPNFALLVSGRGTFNALAKPDSRVLYRFQAGTGLSAPLAQYGEIAYVSSSDFSVYAVDIPQGRVLWRFLGGGPILRQPAIMDEDVYVTPEGAGLYRLDRSTGEAHWHNRNADRFVAANGKVVYATDRSGRLLILDRARGTQLGIYAGARDLVVPISNELTDRLFLASNDGLFLCLHDRGYPTPLRMKAVHELEPVPPTAEANKAPLDKGEIKKPDAAKGQDAEKTPER
jgi:hypothetical protein